MQTLQRTSPGDSLRRSGSSDLASMQCPAESGGSALALPVSHPAAAVSKASPVPPKGLPFSGTLGTASGMQKAASFTHIFEKQLRQKNFVNE